jgi:hypothetical protein
MTPNWQPISRVARLLLAGQSGSRTVRFPTAHLGPGAVIDEWPLSSFRSSAVFERLERTLGLNAELNKVGYTNFAELG